MIDSRFFLTFYEDKVSRVLEAPHDSFYVRTKRLFLTRSSLLKAVPSAGTNEAHSVVGVLITMTARRFTFFSSVRSVCRELG